MITPKYDGNKRQGPGRPRKADEIGALVVRIANENRHLGCRRIQGALANMGHDIWSCTIVTIEAWTAKTYRVVLSTRQLA